MPLQLSLIAAKQREVASHGGHGAVLVEDVAVNLHLRGIEEVATAHARRADAALFARVATPP